MIIEFKSYDRYHFRNESTYIHRYYLSRELHNVLQAPDMAALNNKINEMLGRGATEETVRAELASEPVFIHYKAQSLVKEIGLDLLSPAIEACLRYRHDNSDVSVSDEETNVLLSLNEWLRKLEWDIHQEALRINLEMQHLQQDGKAFLDDFEVEVHIDYMLAADDPMSRADDYNILYQFNKQLTQYKDNLGEMLKSEETRVADDWNDARHIHAAPLFQVPHSWLFHDLIDHSPLPLKHLCRIGTIWVDITSTKQRFVKVGINREGRKSWGA